MISYKRLVDMVLKQTTYYGGSFRSGMLIIKPDTIDNIKDVKMRRLAIEYYYKRARNTSSYSVLVSIYNGVTGEITDHTSTLKVNEGVRGVDQATTELVQKLLVSNGCVEGGVWGYGIVIKTKGHNFTDNEIDEWVENFQADGLVDMEKRDELIEAARLKRLKHIEGLIS